MRMLRKCRSDAGYFNKILWDGNATLKGLLYLISTTFTVDNSHRIRNCTEIVCRWDIPYDLPERVNAAEYLELIENDKL